MNYILIVIFFIIFISLLHKIQSEISAENPASSDTIILPKDTKIYNIDLDTREIEAPEVLSV